MTPKVAAAVLTLLPSVLATAQSLEFDTLEHDGVVRDFGWYAGTGVGPTPTPLVILLHGGGGHAAQVWAGDDGRAWRRIADRDGLVLLLPQGSRDPGLGQGRHWNDCRTGVLEPSVATDADDVGFLRALVDRAASRWPIDADRVYVTGPSNGGMMSFRLAMEASALIAAAAPIIANLPDPSECRDPSRPVPMLIMNGTDDPLMPWSGGCIVNPRCERGRVLSTAETVGFWVAFDATDPTATCVDLPDVDPGDGSTVTVCTYAGGTAGTEVVLYRIDGGGHAVPGPDDLPFWYRLIAGRKNHDISAPDEIWAFFERNRRTSAAPRSSGDRVGAP